MNPTYKNCIPIIFSWFLVYFYLFSGCSEDVRQITLESETDWPVYLGDNSGSQYSPLSQITPENVHLLEPVWENKTENLKKDDRTQIQCNLLIIDGILYSTSPKLRVFALNAATGKRIWEFNPSQEINFAMNVNRGVTWWSDGTDKRIFFTAGAVLYALNAETGRLVSTFGNNGKVSLKEGLGENAADKYVVATSPGIVYKDLIVMGSRVSENIDEKSVIDSDNSTSFTSFKSLVKEHRPKVIPKTEVGKMLPWVHIAISNAKKMLLDIFHDI